MNGQGHNSAAYGQGLVEPKDWVLTVAESEAHAFIKLIIHTLEMLVQDGQQATQISDERLAHLTSLSVKTIRKYRRDAMGDGWLSFSLGNGRGQVTEYRITVPPKTLSELARKMEQASKGYPEKDTFSGDLGEYRAAERVPPQGNITPERLPLEEKGTLKRLPLEGKGYPEKVTFAGSETKEIPPTPPKENNTKKFTPVGPHDENPGGPAEAKKRARQMPPDWRPAAETISWAKGKKIGATDDQIAEQFDAFRDFHQSKGNRFLNWDQAFQTWMRKAKQFGNLDQKHRKMNGSYSLNGTYTGELL